MRQEIGHELGQPVHAPPLHPPAEVLDWGGGEQWWRHEEPAEVLEQVSEAPWSGAEWAVALRFDNPRATALVRLLG